jgi:hypothetical protein
MEQILPGHHQGPGDIVNGLQPSLESRPTRFQHGPFLRHQGFAEEVLAAPKVSRHTLVTDRRLSLVSESSTRVLLES